CLSRTSSVARVQPEGGAISSTSRLEARPARRGSSSCVKRFADDATAAPLGACDSPIPMIIGSDAIASAKASRGESYCGQSRGPQATFEGGEVAVGVGVAVEVAVAVAVAACGEAGGAATVVTRRSHATSPRAAERATQGTFTFGTPGRCSQDTLRTRWSPALV